MGIKTKSDVVVFAIIVTLGSLCASLLLTWAVSGNGLTPHGLIPATLVPSIVAPLASFWIARMMVRIHELNQRLEFLLRHDQMTGLLTRAAFFQGIEQESGAKNGAVLMADIDRFKSINDTFGHHAGDCVIREVSNILRQGAEPDGLAARFGGEEFVAFLPDADLRHAELRAEAIRAAVENQSISVEGSDLSCTLSIGVEVFDGSQPLDDVLRAADQALYMAKSNGRNRVVRQCVRRPTPSGTDS